MSNRVNLHEILCDVLGSRQVYFQPPETVRMKYPAIVYSKSQIENKHADDNVYMQLHSYSVTVIDKDPDSAIVDNVSQLPRCRFDRHYVADNLNHDTFTIYY